MYPIDVLKVSNPRGQQYQEYTILIGGIDSHASRQSDTGCSIYGRVQRNRHNIKSRRSRCIMARDFECDRRRRYDRRQGCAK